MNRFPARITTLFALLTLSCGGLMIDSRWPDRDIVIDGDDTDWQDLKFYVQDWPFDIGLANDADFLYLTLSTADRSLQRQAIMRGFEVWIDPNGGQSKILGVRYPLGVAGRGREGFERAPGEQGLDDSFQGRRYRDDREMLRGAGPEQLQEAFERMLTGQQPMLLGRGSKEIRSLSMLGENDVRVMVTLADGRLVYEARFPLRGQYPLPPLPSKPDKRIGIGFRTRDLDFSRAFQNRDELAGQRGGGFGGGGFGGGQAGGGFGGREGSYGDGVRRRRGPGFASTIEPIEKWTKVTLAKSPTGQPPE